MASDLAIRKTGWETKAVSGNEAIVVGSKGRIVLPAEMRAQLKWEEGTVLVPYETEKGVLLVSREDALQMLRTSLKDAPLTESLFADRRAEAEREDQGIS